jgi:hypothetical protein
MPLLLATAAASGLTWLFEEGFEWAFVASSAVIGCASLFPAYRHVHRKKACLALFGAGVVIILMGRLAETGLPDTPFVVFGAALIVAGMRQTDTSADPAGGAAAFISGLTLGMSRRQGFDDAAVGYLAATLAAPAQTTQLRSELL